MAPSSLPDGVDGAVRAAQRVLSKNLLLLDNSVSHLYTDKFAVAEQCVWSASIASVNAILALGFKAEDIERWREGVVKGKVRAVVLQFDSRETCTFIEKKERKVEVGGREQKGKIAGIKVKRTEKNFNFVMDYMYKFTFSWKLSVETILSKEGEREAERGVGEEEFGSSSATSTSSTSSSSSSPSSSSSSSSSRTSVTGMSRSCEGYTIVTQSEELPRAEKREHPQRSVNLTWLLRCLPECRKMGRGKECSGSGCEYCGQAFRIDRENPLTRTPRRNPYVEEAGEFFQQLSMFCVCVYGMFLNDIFRVELSHNLDLSACYNLGRKKRECERASGKIRETERMIGWNGDTV